MTVSPGPQYFAGQTVICSRHDDVEYEFLGRRVEPLGVVLRKTGSGTGGPVTVLSDDEYAAAEFRKIADPPENPERLDLAVGTRVRHLVGDVEMTFSGIYNPVMHKHVEPGDVILTKDDGSVFALNPGQFLAFDNEVVSGTIPGAATPDALVPAAVQASIDAYRNNARSVIPSGYSDAYEAALVTSVLLAYGRAAAGIAQDAAGDFTSVMAKEIGKTEEIRAGWGSLMEDRDDQTRPGV